MAPCSMSQMKQSGVNSTSNQTEFERVFSRFDADGDGKISPAELRRLMWCISHELSLEDAEAAVMSSDSNGDGLLDMKEFIQFMGSDGEDEEEEERELREAFAMYEMKGEGCITAKSLKRMLSRMGTSRAVEECMTMFCKFDGNGDGVLSFEEFKAMMNRTYVYGH